MITSNRSALFSSDWHLGHKRVAELRGFDSIDEHDHTLLTNVADMCLRAETRKEDSGADIFFGGDLTRGGKGPEERAFALINEYLPDSTRLYSIAGNHDSWWDGHPNAFKQQGFAQTVFESTHSFMRFNFNGYRVWYSHFPYGDRDHTENGRYLTSRLSDEGEFLLHGHTHQVTRQFIPNGYNIPCRQIHVGVDAWDMRPATQGQIQSVIDNIVKHEEEQLDKDNQAYASYLSRIGSLA